MQLSGGMKRRVMIAKALSHEPEILFLDEPTAGVDVALRKDMWEMVRQLRERGHHHPHHALHRGSRRDGRPHRRHPQGRADPGRAEGGADAKARQEAADARAADRRLELPASARGPQSRALGAMARADLYLRRPERAQRHQCAPRRPRPARHPLQGPADPGKFARGYLRQSGEGRTNEPRSRQSHLPVRDGAHLPHAGAIDPRPGDLDLALFRGLRRGHRLAHHRDRWGHLWRLHRARAHHADDPDSDRVSNGSFGIYFPKFLGTIYELLSAPVSAFEIVLGYVGAAASKSILLGVIVLATAGFFVPIRIDHPIWMLASSSSPPSPSASSASSSASGPRAWSSCRSCR